MVQINAAWTEFTKDPSEWPFAICPECGVESTTTRRPLGTKEICTNCLIKRHGPGQQETEEELQDRWAAERAEREARGRANRIANLSEFLSDAGCPPRYEGFTRTSWEAAYGPWAGSLTGRLDGWTGETADTWLVLLYGLYGRRKTSLATALLGERIIAGKQCLWLDAVDWCQRMQAGFRDDTASDIYERAKEAAVLLLDDVGAILGGRSGRREEQSWWAEQVAMLLRHREAWILPTIVTANVKSIAELGTIDNSLVPRMDVELAFEMPGENYRTRERSC